MGASGNLKSFIKENKRLLREYIETKVQLFKLRFVRLFSSMAGHLIWILLCLFVFWLFIVFLALVTGFWLSEITGSYPVGFGITTLAILMVLIILVFWGKKALVNSVIRKIIAEAAHELNLKEDQKLD